MYSKNCSTCDTSRMCGGQERNNAGDNGMEFAELNSAKISVCEDCLYTSNLNLLVKAEFEARTLRPQSKQLSLRNYKLELEKNEQKPPCPVCFMFPDVEGAEGALTLASQKIVHLRYREKAYYEGEDQSTPAVPPKWRCIKCNFECPKKQTEVPL